MKSEEMNELQQALKGINEGAFKSVQKLKDLKNNDKEEALKYIRDRMEEAEKQIEDVRNAIQKMEEDN